MHILGEGLVPRGLFANLGKQHLPRSVISNRERNDEVIHHCALYINEALVS